MTAVDWLAVAIGLIWAAPSRTKAAPLWIALLITGALQALSPFQHSRWTRCCSVSKARDEGH